MRYATAASRTRGGEPIRTAAAPISAQKREGSQPPPNRFLYHSALIQVGVCEPSLFCAEMGAAAVRMGSPPRVRLAAAAYLISLVKAPTKLLPSLAQLPSY